MSKTKKEQSRGFKSLLTAKADGIKLAGGIILRIIILLAIPYAYLMLCGLIFDWWLRMYELTTFIFYSLMVLYAAALALIVISIVWTVQYHKKAKEASEEAKPEEAE